MPLARSIDLANTKTLVCDVMDVHPGKARLLDAGVFRDFGGRVQFHGVAVTIKCLEDNSLVRPAVEEAGNGRVLVIDGAGSLRTSLVGGVLATAAAKNGWAGIIVFGALRDVAEMIELDLGIKALAPCPQSSAKKGQGARDVPVAFAGQAIKPGDYIYADGDGIVVTDAPVH